MKSFLVKKNDLQQTKIVDNQSDIDLSHGEVLLQIEAFSFSTNNITYWAMGEKLKYWQFFPVSAATDEAWGQIPVWGFARVVASQTDEVTVGERVFGYLPTAEQWVMRPVKVNQHTWIDGSAQRQALPAGYNIYRRELDQSDQQNPNQVAAQRQQEALRMLLFPLHITSFCLYDMLRSQQWLQAAQIIIVSASSKTSLGLAHALKQNDQAPQVLGLTSQHNLQMVEDTGYYDQAWAYEDWAQIKADKPSVVVDMSGNGALIGNLHQHLGENMLFSSHVGLTHLDAAGMTDGFIAERSQMFFAPAHIEQRHQDWGAAEFERQATEFMMRTATDSARWLQLKELSGLSGLSDQFSTVAAGSLPACEGLIVRM